MSELERPRLCVTVAAATTAELRHRRDAAAVLADIVELRLDTVSDPDVAAAIDGRRGPVVVTCRPERLGGRFAGSEDERLRLLRSALTSTAEYVDLEWNEVPVDLWSGAAARVVLSHHDFEEIPADLEERSAAMHALGPAIVKLAVRTDCLADLVRLQRLAGAAGDVAAVGMGRAGATSRVLAARLGTAWTYAGDMAEVGQLPARQFVDRFRFRHITANTAVYGVVGSSAEHSVLPAIHNAALGALGVDAVYATLPAATADDFFQFATAFGVNGASITAPFKQAFYERVDHMDDVSRRVGAVDTIRREGARWVGLNADVEGFLAPLDGRLELRGASCSILGAGGAARAVAVALASRGARVILHARSIRQGREAARGVGASSGRWPPPGGTWDLLVNATPVGTHPHGGDSPAPEMPLTGRCVYDLVYHPPRTRLLADAEAAGLETIDGLQMLIAQAGHQLAWWTGQRPSADLLRRAALDALAEADAS